MRSDLLAVVVLCVFSARAFAGWEAPLPPGKNMRVAVPRIAAPPKIDGIIDAEEWREAAATSGVGGCTDNLLYARPTVFWLAWDPENIYVASRIWLRPGYKPQVSGREPGAAGVFDDTLEFHWQPMGKNVPDGRTASSYKWLINALGFDGDFMRVAVGQQFKNWNPKFKIAARLTDNGTAPLGGRWLEVEFAASWQDFELKGQHQAGDLWRMQLGTNHMYAGWDQARIPCTTSYFDPPGYAQFELVEKAPAVQMLMDNYPMPNEGVLQARWQIRNPTDKPLEVALLAQVLVMDRQAKDGGEELFKFEKNLVIPAGALETVAMQADYQGKISDKQKGGLFFLATAKDQVLYRHFHYFLPGFPAKSRQPVAPPAAAFPLAITFNPVKGTVEIKTDAYYLENPDAAKAMRWEIAAKDGAALRAGTSEKAVHYFRTARVALPDLKPGEYEVKATMLMADNQELGPVIASFTKLDEAKEFAEWWNTKLGDTERIIHPFAAIRVEGDAISPWGRTYRLNRLGLPAQIISQGKAITAGSGRVVAIVGGQETVIPLAGAPEFTEQKDWRVRFQGAANGAGLLCKAQGWIEQDGLVYVELTYGPEGDAVHVEGLRLEYPISGAEGETFLCLGTGGNYSARTTMILPSAKERQGRLWSTLDTGRNGAQMTVGSFYPCLWIGNEQRGLLWHADSDCGWVPDDEVPAHELWRQGEDLLLRNNIIGKPCKLVAPRTIAFAYMASPFRPHLKNRRSAFYSEDGTFHGPNKVIADKDGKIIVDGWAWLTPPSEKPEEWSGMWAEYKKMADERCHKLQWRDPALARNKYGSTVHTSLPLMGYGWKSPDKRVTGYFAADWVEGGDSWNKSEQDYFLYIADRAFREGGLRTIYWDIFMLHLFRSPIAGLGYELTDGRIQPAYNGMNIRRFMMRMYALMQDHGLAPGSQVGHCTNCYLLVASAWMDALLDGEYHSLGDDSTMDWVDGYPIDRMRAMSVSGMFGWQLTWMDLIGISDKKRSAWVRRGKQDYLRLYDTWRGWGNLWMPPFDWGLHGMEYRPFWRQPVICDNPQVLVSAWTMPGRVILAAFNYDRDNVQSAVIKLYRQALGLMVKESWLGAIAVRGLQGVAPEFNPLTDEIRLSEIQPHTGAVVAIRATEKANYDRLLAALQEAAKGLPEANRPAVVPDGVLNFGFADAPVKALPWQEWTDAEPQAAIACLQLPDRILLAIANAGAKALDMECRINMERLKLVPELPWQEFVQERDFGPKDKDGATLDFHQRLLRVPKVAPGTLRLVAIRRF